MVPYKNVLLVFFLLGLVLLYVSKYHVKNSYKKDIVISTVESSIDIESEILKINKKLSRLEDDLLSISEIRISNDNNIPKHNNKKSIKHHQVEEVSQPYTSNDEQEEVSAVSVDDITFEYLSNEHNSVLLNTIEIDIEQKLSINSASNIAITASECRSTKCRFYFDIAENKESPELSDPTYLISMLSEIVTPSVMDVSESNGTKLVSIIFNTNNY